ncbi:hypothetical protein AMATHDRAFT_38260 [Amanita thiersii Skay4041]|uniref:Phorbol-ester/DAG-type domain-containing protein n=1 Tax=Amanita thiersii Skay4041 TaxID=703135 RepID=A0A2A9P017_9AGAR|nr:hypothetical protein AMATHDRAFT_38260 [Amanita thiersii Skay4041]
MSSSLQPLRIDTSNLPANPPNSERISWQAPPTSKSVSSFRISLSSTDERPSISSLVSDLGRTSSKLNKKTRNESRKLLSHVLAQLQARPMPPLIFDSYNEVTSSINRPRADTLKSPIRGNLNRGPNISAQSQYDTTGDASDDESQLDFSTDYTYDLMIQLRDVLLLSISQGWQIFENENAIPAAGLQSESLTRHHPVRKSKSAFQPTSERRSRSPSPARWPHVQAPELLTQCVHVIASVVQEDCRYKVAAPRPLRPPNALHAICLDIAQFLLHAHRHLPRVVSQIGFAIIPAFSTFPREMQGRLLKFFEECIIRGLLQELSVSQGGRTEDSIYESNASIMDEQRPIVSIQVDEVQDDDNPIAASKPAWKRAVSSARGILSNTSPMQSKSVYYLASLISPLLATVLEHIDVIDTDIRPERLHALGRLLNLISQLKIDACNDILQIIAYEAAQARRAACVVLASFWGKSLGHSAITQPPASVLGAESPHHFGQPHQHQFLPWRYQHPFSEARSIRINKTICQSCSKQMTGFGLLCAFCMCSVHFDCYDYPQGCSQVQYSVSADSDVQKVAMYRFCSLLPDKNYPEPGIKQIRGHEFETLNMFTLCLCYQCKTPLWGCTSQGFGCTSCSIFLHSACFTAVTSDIPWCGTWTVNSTHMTIDWGTLRTTCLDYYRQVLSISEEELKRRSYEEISILCSTLWTQLQILTSGIALGSLVVIYKGKDITDDKIRQFELHRIIQWCTAILSTDNIRCSQSIEDYLLENKLSYCDYDLMFDWSTLILISTACRTVYVSEEMSPNRSLDYMNVTGMNHLSDSDFGGQCMNVISLSYMRDILGTEFNITSDIAFNFLFQHLQHLSFFHILDDAHTLTSNDQKGDDRMTCAFTLPFGLDSSVEVEILVSAIEACLSDVNLFINEVGFLLLSRRLCPNGMSSEYALRRLARSVVTWILTEDSSLAIVLRDFLAKKKALPGVPQGLGYIWPNILGPRFAPSGSMTNGGDYVAFRRALQTRYASPWLLALHDYDPTLYPDIVYDACEDVVNLQAADGTLDIIPISQTEKYQAERCDRILRYISKLSQAQVVYTAFDELILRWLNFASVSRLREPLMSLHRIFQRDNDNAYRHSSSFDTSIAGYGNPDVLMVDAWRPVVAFASRNQNNLTCCLEWLDLLALAGVEVPIVHLIRFTNLVTDKKRAECLSAAVILVSALLKNVYQHSIGRQSLLVIPSKLHTALDAAIVEAIRHPQNFNLARQFIRQSLASCLLLYGGDRKKLSDLGLIIPEDIQGLPSRKRVNNQHSLSGDPITIDPSIMNALEKYLSAHNDEISCLLAKFFNTFLIDSPFLESYEVDNFILRNGRLLAQSAWQFYTLQKPDLCDIRASFFIRTIVVDPQPFHELFQGCLLPRVPWENRLSATSRLFRITQDITNPAFRVEGRHWRSSVTSVFSFYFKSLWTDEREEIRLAVKTSSSTLLPAHFEEITLCWIELLATAPIPERVRLVNFLIHLLPYFPSWKVLSWRAIVEALLEYEYDQHSAHNEDGPASAHLSVYGISSKPEHSRTEADPDMMSLRIGLVLLSMRMIANGVSVDVASLVKLKKHVTEIVGFGKVMEIPHPSGNGSRIEFGDVETISEQGFPCIHELVAVLDAPYPFELPPAAMTSHHHHIQEDKSSRLLVGSLFVDVVLATFCTVKDIKSLPILTLKSILESMCIIVYKHNFESLALSHLQHRLRQAITRCLELTLQDIGYEVRQVALSFIQGFVKQCNKIIGPVIYKCIEQIAKLIASESHHGSDALVAQARSFLENTLTMYASNGLFSNLLKRRLDREFFIVLKQVMVLNKSNQDDLKEALLHDVMVRAVDVDHGSLQATIDNILTFIEMVHHEDYSAESILLAGQQLTSLARRVSERSSDQINPSSLFTIPAVLVENNKSHLRDVLPYAENVTRIILTRLKVTFASLFRFLSAMHCFQRRSESAVSTTGIAQLILEIYGDGLRLKARIHPFTLTTLFQVIVHNDDPKWLPLSVTYPQMFVGLVDNALHFLQNYEWPEAELEDAFMASLSAAKIVWKAAEQDSNITIKMADFGLERSGPSDFSVRAWNILTLTALRHPDRTWAAALLPLLHIFSHVQFNTLRTYVYHDSAAWDPNTTNINHAYSAIKLWLLLAHKVSTDAMEGDISIFHVWNELWSPFETLAFSADKQVNLHPILSSLISSSVADLFMFLHSLHVPLALQTSSQIATLERLKTMTGIDTAVRKVSRAIQGLSKPPIPLQWEATVNQIAKDLVAAERLRTLESRRGVGKNLPERRPAERPRRDVRLPT